ncbi:MAG: TIGR04255 family protein [Actinomycetota bacterium]
MLTLPGNPLPNYRKPPVTEVALAVRFQPVEAMSPLTVARLYGTRFEKDGFPQFQEKTAVQMPLEQFGRSARIPEFRIEIAESLDARRYWFVNSDQSQLVQIQRDWFARNWRRVADLPYPRYPSVREPFHADLEFLDSFLQDQGAGGINPIQCELTYVNELAPMPGVWEKHGDVDQLMRWWSAGRADQWHPDFEEVHLSIAFIIKIEEKAVGRLRLNLVPGYTRAEGSPVYLLTLTARGAPLDQGLAGTMDFLDIGHDWIVRTFDSFTSERLHEIWGKA